MRKSFKVVTLIVLAAGLAGCATLPTTIQKKFTRKPKEVSHKPVAVYTQEGAYQKQYSNDYYYKTHYTMWKSWMSELINQLGGNSKKLSRCGQESLSHLTEMNRYLVPDKQAELKPMLDSLTELVAKLDDRGFSDSELGGVRTELEKIMRIVGNNFYYDKIKASLIPDTVDLGA